MLDGDVTGESTSTVTDSLGWSAIVTGVPIGAWYFDEASTWFFIMAIVIGIIGGLSEKQIVNTFIAGAADMMSVVLIIALARGISVLMASTGLDVYVLDAAANALAGLSGIIFAPMSYLVYFGLSLAKIEWTTWLKFAMKVIVVIALVSVAILTIACVMI